MVHAVVVNEWVLLCICHGVFVAFCAHLQLVGVMMVRLMRFGGPNICTRVVVLAKTAVTAHADCIAVLP